MIEEPKRRRHSRCVNDAEVAFSIINKTQRNEAIARNYSHSGIYFEAIRFLAPGTLIVIRHKGYDASGDMQPQSVSMPLTVADSEACQELKMQVVGQVKRCEKLGEDLKPLYGIAVQYVSPSV